jgi:hypothetical protein
MYNIRKIAREKYFAEPQGLSRATEILDALGPRVVPRA